MSQNPFDSFDSAYLASLNNAYRAAQVKSRSGVLLPEGKYQCIIASFKLNPSKIYSDELLLLLGFEVLEGEQKGKTAYKFYNIVPEGLDQLKTDMNTLGIDLDGDIRLLGEYSTADSIIDQIVDISVKHKKKEKSDGVYQNIYIDRSLGKIGNSFQEVTDDDELPFE